MIAGSFLLTALEKSINRFLQLDPESVKRLAKIEHKTIGIELLPFHLIFQMQIESSTIRFIFPATEQSDAMICGTPLRLLHVSLAKQRKAFFSDDVKITGNLELGQAILDVFDQLDIDWEEILSHWTGDVPAYHVGRVARHIKTFMKKTHQTLRDDVNEYVHEEIALFPAREALQDFFHDVDEIRMESDRLEARINHLLAV